MTGTRLRLGTRGSALAVAQARRVAARLSGAHPALDVALVEVRTAGDRDRTRPLAAFGEVGVFVKELERALQEDRIDAAVHSAKDVPTTLSDGLVLAAFPEREPAWDVLITRRAWPQADDGLPALPRGARVATGSVRRRAQLLHWRPDLEVPELRGNVDTRLRRLFEEDLDGIVLAAAGLRRLGLLGRDGVPAPGRPLAIDPGAGRPPAFAYPLDPLRFVPAPGQGALAVEVRAADEATHRLVAGIDDPAVSLALRAERAFLAGVGSTCTVPVGAHARVEGDRLTLRVYYAAAPEPYAAADGDLSDPEGLGSALARRMLGGGPAGPAGGA